ncbi:hypothetical protein HOV23_gp038 [Pseudomonas phage Lana]|uniref:Deoxynucleotide monophosphate kinase n=1 Tax=Pseudomonas phage Lana TaxID=2530172 RepID=A0A481W6D2_9CAUD|nr:hypothetical protein HOV23_gp038 [Pseudomonas phage Lana]QBJ04535.1 hypothetical protein [Pseudomonas phage Lana]
MKLIGVTGLARSGKDHAADYLVRHMSLYKYAFAEPLKTMLKSVFGDHFHHGDRSGICPETGVSYRVMMQTLGTEWGRALHDNVWVNLVDRKWKWVEAGCPWKTELGEFSNAKVNGTDTVQGMVLSDVRFNSEAHWVRDQHGVVLQIVRPGLEQQTVGVEGHASEKGVNPAFVTHTIVNDGSLFDFEMKLLELVTELEGNF